MPSASRAKQWPAGSKNLAWPRKKWDWFVANGGITDEQEGEVLGALPERQLHASAAQGLVPPRLALLAREVWKRGLYSEGQLARLLQLDRHEIREVLDGAELEESEANELFSFPINADTILVADASVIINLNATGRARDIIQAQPGSLVVTENAFAELSAGAKKGHDDHVQLQALIDIGAVRIVTLGEAGASIYAALVEGSALRTLDDGEAATIGYAHETGAHCPHRRTKGDNDLRKRFS